MIDLDKFKGFTSPDLLALAKSQQAKIAKQEAVIAELKGALKKLTFIARTSGGTAGRDEALCSACDVAEAALTASANTKHGGRDE